MQVAARKRRCQCGSCGRYWFNSSLDSFWSMFSFLFFLLSVTWFTLKLLSGRSFESCWISGWERRQPRSCEQKRYNSSLDRFWSMFYFFLSMIYLLTCCFQYGHLEVVKFLFEKGAKVDHADNDGTTPLWIASQVCLFFCQNDVTFNAVSRMIIWKLSNFWLRKAPKLIEQTMTVQLLFRSLLK